MTLLALFVARVLFAARMLGITIRKHASLIVALLLCQTVLLLAGLALGVFRQSTPLVLDLDASVTGTFINANGTMANGWSIAGPTGPQILNDGGVIEARNAAASALVNVRGAYPVVAQDLTTKAYVDQFDGGTIHLPAGDLQGNGSTNANPTISTLTGDAGAVSMLASVLQWSTPTLVPFIEESPQTSDTAANNFTLQSQAAFQTALAGTFNTQSGMAAVTSTISGVVSPGQVVVFGNQPGVGYTINTWSGTSGTLTGNFTGTTNASNTAIQISATGANQSAGNIVLDTNTSLLSTRQSYIYFKNNGFLYGALGGLNGSTNFGTLYLKPATSSSLVPSGTNYVLASDGSILYINGPATAVKFEIAGAGVLFELDPTVVQIALSTVQFTSGVGTPPVIDQVAKASTSTLDGGAGESLSIIAQAGQAATGANGNGGAGGPLILSSGAGGTSVDASAGNPGPVNLETGGTVVSGVDYSGQYVTQSAGISTASATHTLTAAEIVKPYLVLTGTTATPTCTFTLPNPPLTGTTRFWYVDWSTVTIGGNSIVFQAGTPGATATITAATAISKVLILFEPDANDVYLLGI